MSLFAKLLGRTSPVQPDTEDGTGDQRLVPVPIPALAAILQHLEQDKGSPLTEAEVLDARDRAVCMMLPVSRKLAMDATRGYADIDPQNAWAEWVALRRELVGDRVRRGNDGPL